MMHAPSISYVDLKNLSSLLMPFPASNEPRPVTRRIYAGNKGGERGYAVVRVYLNGRNVTDDARWVDPVAGQVGLYVRGPDGITRMTRRRGILKPRIRISRGRVTLSALGPTPDGNGQTVYDLR